LVIPVAEPECGSAAACREARWTLLRRTGYPVEVAGSDADTPKKALFQQLAAVTDAMVFVTDVEANTSLWVNDTLVEMTGYSLEDYKFQRFENPFIPAQDAARVGAFLLAFLASDALVSGFVRNRFVDRWGGTLHVRSRIAKVDWEGRSALLYWTVLERREGDASIDVEQRYRSLVEAATDSIVRLRPDLTVHFSNRCFQDLVGRPPVELSTLPFTKLVLDSHREAVGELLRGDTTPLQLAAPLRTADGGTVWVEGVFVRIARGPDVGLLQAMLRDTTERRLLDARMQEAQKRESLGQMAGGIAHDLNNILTAIMGWASLAESARDPGRVTEALSSIRVAAERAGELSSSMLAFAGEGNAERVSTDLAELVSELKPLLASAFAKNVTLVVATPTAPVVVVGDEVQLRQVVMNVITNAADATGPQGGDVRVETGIEEIGVAFGEGEHLFGTPPNAGRAAVVRVQDQGCGIAPERIPHIFEPFHTSKAKGRGLGLAAVLGILTRHEGCVRVRSEVGAGTQIELVLPLTGTPVATPGPQTRSDFPTGHKGTILVVDDEPMLREVMRRAFVGVGFEVLEAGSGEEALERLDQHGDRVTAVVLDRSMPGMGGERALVEIRARLPELPVLRISGDAAGDMLTADDHKTTFLGKPYGVRQLIDAVLGLLDRV